jgi:hypothetical protein
MNVFINRSLQRTAFAVFVAGWLFAGPASADAISGAIFTTDSTGTVVDGNNYALKTDVYLNGGPNGPGCHGGALEDGIYYFQVTNPNGSVLLSSDGIAARKFQVGGGEISANLGTHATGATSPCGSLAIQLMPFANTPNNGGVYKVWITRVTDFTAACGANPDCGRLGFVPGHTKTDNFRAPNGDDQQINFGALEAFKFYDANASGTFDAGDIELAGWEMTLTSTNQGVDETQFTGSDGTTLWDPLIPDGDYFVEEGMPTETNWVHSATIYDGHDGSPQNPAGPLAVNVGETTEVAFGNYCTVPSGGHTLGFWSNKNGQAKLNDGNTMNPEFTLLNALHLRTAGGLDFDLDLVNQTQAYNYLRFRSWLLSATATNMAYMLSAQLAAMRLNVEAGFVSGSAYYVPAGHTVTWIMSAADTSLGLYPVTIYGSAQRSNQEQLKNWLDELNNNAGVLSPTPCAYTFP